MRITLDNRTISISDIWATVTCRECGDTYQVQMSRPRQIKNCRCGKGTFIFINTVRKGAADVSMIFIDHNGTQYNVEPDSLEIDDD